MAVFVEVVVADALAKDAGAVKKLVEVCPVDIFKAGAGGKLEIVDANLDECTLCELCLAVGKPGEVRVKKLYDDTTLQRTA